jgi:hypothetical protein
MTVTVPLGDLVRAGVSDPAVAPANREKIWVDDVDDRVVGLTIPHTTGGRSEPGCSHPPDRRRSFTRKKSKLNTKSPPGGGPKFSRSSCCGPAGVACADFFLAAVDFGNSNAIKEFKSRVLSTLDREVALQNRPFIFRPPGGAVKSSGPLETGPVPPQRASLREFPRTFFYTPRGVQISGAFRSGPVVQSRKSGAHPLE